jgi:hypothetical protein
LATYRKFYSSSLPEFQSLFELFDLLEACPGDKYAEMYDVTARVPRMYRCGTQRSKEISCAEFQKGGELIGGQPLTRLSV